MKQGLDALARATTVAILMLGACAAQAQTVSQTTKPFEIVEATIDDIHMAMRAGKLTARQLVQGYLDRINAYDKQGPTINSIITLNPNALAEADRLDAGVLARTADHPGAGGGELAEVPLAGFIGAVLGPHHRKD